MLRRRIDRTPAGAIRLELSPEERSLLHDVADELRSVLAEAPEDPSLRRLYPTAHEDEELEREFRDLTRSQLEGGRDRAVTTLQETADREVLSRDEADAWLRALNDARLVLGTRLEIAEDFDWDSFDATHPQAPELALYAYLSGLQEELVHAMA